ncbi:MAG: protein kinase [Myxococcota bacterium]|jgi:TPR repeat protein|nr:protein kinase [Myxococcota bacterium]
MSTSRLSSYDLLEELGRGSFGSVHRALQKHLQREVAVKLIRPEELPSDAEPVARFLREVDVVRRLEHPNIVRLYDFGAEEAGCWMAMELVRGHTLDTLLRRDGAFQPKRAVDIAQQIASALVLAHEGGIVHRDLKPGNVMLSDIGVERDHVTVLDFGIAKAIGPTQDGKTTLTQAGGMIGTPLYMAPEQLSLQPAEPPSDIYALGLILYEMLHGSPAFRGETPFQVLVERGKNPKVALPPWVQGSVLGRLLSRMLEEDSRRRLSSARELHQQLDALDRAALPVAPAKSGTPLAMITKKARRSRGSEVQGSATATAAQDDEGLELQWQASEVPAAQDDEGLELQWQASEVPAAQDDEGLELQWQASEVPAASRPPQDYGQALELESKLPKTQFAATVDAGLEHMLRPQPSLAGPLGTAPSPSMQAPEPAQVHPSLAHRAPLPIVAVPAGRKEKYSRELPVWLKPKLFLSIGALILFLLMMAWFMGEGKKQQDQVFENMGSQVQRERGSEAVSGSFEDCENGNWKPCTDYCVALAISDPRQEMAAAEWLNRACDFYDEACGELGLMIVRGGAVFGSQEEMLDLLDIGCKANLARACYELGNMYERGQGVSSDRGLAMELFQQACAAGDERACQR